MFAVKKLINRDDLANDILLYRRCPRGRLEGDWLADVELYADQFQADYLSLLADQLGIENIDAVRESLREHKTFFDARPAALSLPRAFRMLRAHQISNSVSLR